MTETDHPIGFIGVGLMGRPMVLRLIDAGFKVVVWGRNRTKLAPVLDAGAHWAETAADATRRAGIVLTCLSDTAAVDAVVFGPAGIAAGGGGDKLLVDLSSIRPDATREMAARLAELCGGMGWVDAPVSGGVVGAESGTLVMMAGGDEADLARAMPVLHHLTQRVTHMGPVGAGQTTKLINQLLVGCTVAVVAEATRLALDAGIDVAKVPPALAGGRADSRPLQEWMPRMAAGDGTVESHLRTMLKDLDTVLDLARRTDTALPMTATSAEIHRVMAARGYAEADGTAIFKYFGKAG